MTQLHVEKKKESTICLFQLTQHAINIIAFQAIAVIVVFCIYLILTYSKDTILSLHISFCVIGYVMLMSEAIMLHTTDQLLGPGLTKAKKSKLHGYFIGLGTIMCMIGILLNIITRKTDRHPHFNSAHGIAGLVSFIFIILACLAGVFTIQWNPIKNLIKIPLIWWKIVHSVCGSLGYVSGIVTLCLGYFTWFFKGHTTYDQRLLCTIVTALICFWVMISPLLTMFRYSKTIINRD